MPKGLRKLDVVEKQRGVRPINYTRKDVWVRVAGVLLCASCMTGMQPDWPRAAAALSAYVQVVNKSLPEDKQQVVSQHDYAYLRAWWENFNENGTVHDRPRGGRPRNVNYLEARKAAAIVKAGKLVTHKVKGKTVEHRVHYTSIGEAVRENEELASITHKLGMTPAQLLHAMHEADPDLVHRKIFFKHSFTTQELELRVAFAQDCLTGLCPGMRYLGGCCKTSSSLTRRQSSLTSTHSLMSMSGVTGHDLSFSDVCPRRLPKEGSVTVRFIVAVSAHPAFADKGGLVYMDFTTGTTNINRKHNRRVDGPQPIGDWVYQKDTQGKKAEPAVHTTREEFEDNMFHIIKKWKAKAGAQEPFFLSFDNNSIQATADISILKHPDTGEEISLAPYGQKLALPSYSHDLNRPIEHLFGTVKHRIKVDLYEDWAKYKDAHEMQKLVYHIFHNLAQYGLDRHVAADVAGLPKLWQIISTPAGILFADDEGDVHVGTGGHYPNASAR